MPRNAAIGLSIGVLLVSGYAVFAATGWPWKAALFPLAVGIPLFCLAATELLWAFLGAGEKREAPEPATQRRVALVAGWILAFFAAIVLLGFLAAVPLFLFLYLKLQAREGWALSIGLTAGAFAVFYGLFDALLHLPFPAGLLF